MAARTEGVHRLLETLKAFILGKLEGRFDVRVAGRIQLIEKGVRH